MVIGRFRSPKTEAEEISLLSETVPKNTKYNTRWAVNDFNSWQNTRMNKKAQLERVGGNGLKRTDVENLSATIEHVSAKSLNFWLGKFICEVAKQTGERYPPKKLYLLFLRKVKLKENQIKFYDEHMSIVFCILISRDLYQKLINEA